MEDQEFEQESRDVQLDNPASAEDDTDRRVGLFQFSHSHAEHSFSRSRSRSRSRSVSPGLASSSLADETRRLKHLVGGDSDADQSDASVASLGRRMEQFGTGEEREHKHFSKRKRAPSFKPKSKSKRKPAKRARSQRDEAEEAEALREELNAMYEGKDSASNGSGSQAPVAGMVMSAEDDEPEPMPADIVDWEEVDAAEPERNADRSWCFGCRHTQRVIDVGDKNPYVPDLIKHAEDNWVHTEHKELMRQLQERYNDEIRWTIEDPNQRLPWHKHTIFLHFTRHTKSTRIKYEAESQAIDEMIFTMMTEELFVKNKKTGRKNVNLKKLPAFHKLLEKQERFDKMLKTMRPHNVL